MCKDKSGATSHGLTLSLCQALSGGFWLTREDGLGACAGVADGNDVVGCGDFGTSPVAVNACNPLARSMTLSDPHDGWNLGTDDAHEALNVTKTGLGHGGVMCCTN